MLVVSRAVKAQNCAPMSGGVESRKGNIADDRGAAKSPGKQLDMNAVVQQLQAALVLATSLQQSALTAQALNVEMGQQQQLNAALEQLTQPGLVAYADQGMALLTPETMALSANKDLSLNAANNGSFNVFKNSPWLSDRVYRFSAERSGSKLLPQKMIFPSRRSVVKWACFPISIFIFKV